MIERMRGQAVDLAQTKPLSEGEVPVGTPLAWPIFDEYGTVLLDRGTVVPDGEARAFLFSHFGPCQRDLVADGAGAEGEAEQNTSGVVAIDEMGLTIGARLGLRPRLRAGDAMCSSRIIGIAPNHALFVTPPARSGQSVSLLSGEHIDVVALSAIAVFRFLCSVDAVCKSPFTYLVLSEPTSIRRLRERRALRLRTRLAALYATNTSGAHYDGIGIVGDLSPLGLSLAASRVLGPVGSRMRVALRLKTHDFDAEIKALCTICNVHGSATGSNLTVHGVEFQQLEPSQEINIKAFLFDQQCASKHSVRRGVGGLGQRLR